MARHGSQSVIDVRIERLSIAGNLLFFFALMRMFAYNYDYVR